MHVVGQGEVAAAVRALGLTCEVEYSGLEGLPSIDVALVQQARHSVHPCLCAIVDTPHHIVDTQHSGLL